MIVSVGNTDVKMGKKALSGVKSLSKESKKMKQGKKGKKQKVQKEKPVLNEATMKKLREQRETNNKMRSERWTQVIADVSARSDLSDLHKRMIEKLAEPQFANTLPRKNKKKFVNFMLLSCSVEAKHAKDAEELFGILKTAEGSVPMSVKRKESRLKKALKKKLRKEAEAATGVKKEKTEKKVEEGMDLGEDGDVDMEANAKKEVKLEAESDESGNDSDSGAGETLQVKGRSKKNRNKLEKVGKKVVHLQGKLNKNMKGKGKNNKKRRNK